MYIVTYKYHSNVLHSCIARVVGGVIRCYPIPYINITRFPRNRVRSLRNFLCFRTSGFIDSVSLLLERTGHTLRSVLCSRTSGFAAESGKMVLDAQNTARFVGGFQR